MYLKPKAKASLRALKIPYPVKGFESHKSMIRILKCKMETDHNLRKRIRLPY